MTAERDIVLLFAGLLMGGSLALLLLPLMHRLAERGWMLLGLFAAPILAVAVGGIAMVVFVGTNDQVLLPVVAVVAVLRSLSPTLTFLKVRERWETTRFWEGIKLLLIIVFPAMAAYLGYRLLVPATADPVILSERILMAAGTALLLARFYFLVLPKVVRERVLLWCSAVIFSVALGVVAPYAFPGFDVYYSISGIIGWGLGLFLALRSV